MTLLMQIMTQFPPQSGTLLKEALCLSPSRVTCIITPQHQVCGFLNNVVSGAGFGRRMAGSGSILLQDTVRTFAQRDSVNPRWTAVRLADVLGLQNSGLQPGVRENILRNSLNLEPALILALTKIHPRIEVPASQKRTQSSH
jgi:hypothetical protein